jgi:acylphosphatase
MSGSSASGERRIVRRCVVSGRVQGVYYRATTAMRARDLGLTGHAQNLPDGRVEVLICGSERAVTELIEWLWIGPTAAKVSHVAAEALELAHEHWPDRFRTG